MRALDEEGLTTGDIDYVFLSHRHPDHVFLACLFEKAKYVTFDDHLIYDKDILLEYDKNVLGDDIEIIDTPGTYSRLYPFSDSSDTRSLTVGF